MTFSHTTSTIRLVARTHEHAPVNINTLALEGLAEKLQFNDQGLIDVVSTSDWEKIANYLVNHPKQKDSGFKVYDVTLWTHVAKNIGLEHTPAHILGNMFADINHTAWLAPIPQPANSLQHFVNKYTDARVPPGPPDIMFPRYTDRATPISEWDRALTIAYRADDTKKFDHYSPIIPGFQEILKRFLDLATPEQRRQMAFVAQLATTLAELAISRSGMLASEPDKLPVVLRARRDFVTLARDTARWHIISKQIAQGRTLYQKNPGESLLAIFKHGGWPIAIRRGARDNFFIFLPEAS